jgi:hypothetical protein
MLAPSAGSVDCMDRGITTRGHRVRRRVTIVAAALAGSRHDIDGTTEVAALVALAAGIAGIGSVRLASGSSR